MQLELLIPKAVLELHRFAGNDDGRRMLQGVCLGKFNAVASNGLHIAELEHRVKDVPRNILIPTAAAKTILRGARKGARFYLTSGGFTDRASSSKFQLKRVAADLTSFSVEFAESGEVFPPNYAEVIKGTGNDRAELIGLDLSLLATLIGFLKAVKAGTLAKLEIEGALDPIKSRFIISPDDAPETPETLSLLYGVMPYRIE